MHKLNKT